MSLKSLLMPAAYRAIYLASRRFNDGGVTILSYHSLDDYATPLSTPPRLFERHMALISSLGCNTFTMREVAAHLRDGRSFPARSVAVTFDDGFANFAAAGAPVLRRYNIAATVYIITGMVGRATEWMDGPEPLPSLPVLTWAQIKALHNSGIEIGAHTVNHPFLTACSPHELQTELATSKETLERALGAPVTSLAYPQGDYNRRVVGAARLAGFTSATTVDQGRARLKSDPLRLPRLLVSGNTSLEAIRAFASPGIGPAYVAINIGMKRALGRKRWPRRSPGDVQSFRSVPLTAPTGSEGGKL